ncbi:phosphoesterase PA-phosphatase related [Beutenbergia cavernae DSM 12333]|uniref:Phosphoesterase PA-phosphatase related n=1 Tax=Beutenbergia cavernae (strain ATCC BAA-8 / DSM 12333 / CCUG 43141 / JCM 11478 / NBRC 16432 / NCIMB 13614 / HKI 0122) TaxID=471853 RepID=C5BV01_BEUC1|nr:phosphatase PAP2 family protein [Beutenbergia cavernae]ACQ78375.1 phosphoesterase PA-phosphatase related [Beutenbergia cavernae DSM 12333]
MTDDGGEQASPSSRRPRALGIVGGTLVLLVVTAGGLLRLDQQRWARLDDAASRAIGDADPAVDTVADVLSQALDAFDSWPGYLLIAAMLGVLALQRRWWHLAAAASTALGGVITSQLIKLWVDRLRPEGTQVDTHDASFPSGHSTLAACFVVVVGMCLGSAARRWWWPTGGLLLVAMMLSRVHVHAHWLSDTIAGALLGIGVGMVVWWAMYPQLERELLSEEHRTDVGARAGKNPRAADR